MVRKIHSRKQLRVHARALIRTGPPQARRRRERLTVTLSARNAAQAALH
jgi:hypothetical protein